MSTNKKLTVTWTTSARGEVCYETNIDTTPYKGGLYIGVKNKDDIQENRIFLDVKMAETVYSALSDFLKINN